MPKQYYTQYVTATGEIHANIYTDVPLGLNTAAYSYVVGKYPSESYYISGGTPVEKLESTILVDKTEATTSEVVTFTGIPLGTTMWHPSGTQVMSSTSESWQSLVKGTFKFRFTHTEYKQYEVLVYVNS